MEFIISLKGWLHSSELSSDTGLSTVLLDFARQLEVKRLLLGWIEKKNYFFLILTINNEQQIIHLK